MMMIDLDRLMELKEAVFSPRFLYVLDVCREKGFSWQDAFNVAMEEARYRVEGPAMVSLDAGRLSDGKKKSPLRRGQAARGTERERSILIATSGTGCITSRTPNTNDYTPNCSLFQEREAIQSCQRC